MNKKLHLKHVNLTDKSHKYCYYDINWTMS